MKVAGSATLNAARSDVWEALNDPAVLVRTIPGCQRLETVGEDTYAMTITAGVASVKGTYQGEVRLTDQRPLDSFVLRAAGAGAPGTVSADVVVTLSELDLSTTSLTYAADAVVGGMIGGVGQRMLGGVAKKTAGEFFAAVDDVLTGKSASSTETVPSAAQVGEGASAAEGSAPARVWAAPAPASRGAGFGYGVAVGAVAALAGALVGGWLSRRRG